MLKRGLIFVILLVFVSSFVLAVDFQSEYNNKLSEYNIYNNNYDTVSNNIYVCKNKVETYGTSDSCFGYLQSWKDTTLPSYLSDVNSLKNEVSQLKQDYLSNGGSSSDGLYQDMSSLYVDLDNLYSAIQNSINDLENFISARDGSDYQEQLNEYSQEYEIHEAFLESLYNNIYVCENKVELYGVTDPCYEYLHNWNSVTLPTRLEELEFLEGEVQTLKQEYINGGGSAHDSLFSDISSLQNNVVTESNAVEDKIIEINEFVSNYEETDSEMEEEFHNEYLQEKNIYDAYEEYLNDIFNNADSCEDQVTANGIDDPCYEYLENLYSNNLPGAENELESLKDGVDQLKQDYINNGGSSSDGLYQDMVDLSNQISELKEQTTSKKDEVGEFHSIGEIIEKESEVNELVGEFLEVNEEMSGARDNGESLEPSQQELESLKEEVESIKTHIDSQNGEEWVGLQEDLDQLLENINSLLENEEAAGEEYYPEYVPNDQQQKTSGITIIEEKTIIEEANNLPDYEKSNLESDKGFNILSIQDISEKEESEGFNINGVGSFMVYLIIGIAMIMLVGFFFRMRQKKVFSDF